MLLVILVLTTIQTTTTTTITITVVAAAVAATTREAIGRCYILILTIIILESANRIQETIKKSDKIW